MIFFFFVEIMNVLQLIEYMDFMMNVKEKRNLILIEYHLGKRRYNKKLWETFTDCFNCLPIVAIIDEKIFCCNGGDHSSFTSVWDTSKFVIQGLSPDLQTMEQIRQIVRPTDIPDEGMT